MADVQGSLKVLLSRQAEGAYKGGAVAAYQMFLKLDPHSPSAPQARAALAQLKVLVGP